MTLVNGVLVQAPVKQSDIQGALGVSSSVNKWSQLCTHGNINKWAKYKPVSYNTPANLTVAQRKSVNYGITNIPVWTGNGAVNKMGNFWFGVNTGSANAPACGIQTDYWGYQRPTGGVNSPYRALDFNGYKHDVVAPIGGCTLSTIYISATGSLTIPFSGNGSGQTGGYTVPLSELSGVGVSTGMFGNLYMSVMVRKVGTSIYYVASRNNRWSDDNSTTVSRYVPSATVGNAIAGSCEVFPFLSTKKFEGYTHDLSGETGPVVAMFEKSAVTIAIQYAQADPNGFVAYYQNLTDHSLRYGFSLTNNSSASFRAAYTVSFSPQPTFPSTDTVTATGSIYIASGGTESVSAAINLPSQTASHYRNGYARLEVTAQGGYGIIFYRSTSAAANITHGVPRD